MNLIRNNVYRATSRGMRYGLIGLSLLTGLLLLTSVPTVAESSVVVERDSLYTAYRTVTADVIKARSGAYHIATDKTVIVETTSGTVAVKNGEAKIVVTPHSVKVESIENTIFIQTESGAMTVAEGQTVQLTSPPPQQDPVLTSLGMCE